MSGFAPSIQTTSNLDPRKRVNYQPGMVLGEDEFVLDQFHHRFRDHHATRALHGYGTVSGLGVSFVDGEIRVQPGLAVDPSGRLVCVPVEYCADLAAWVNQELSGDEEPDSVPSSVQLWVSLCWVECATDDVPIPADSCLSAEDSRAPSRILDSFELRLLTEAPAIVGEVTPGDVDLAGLAGQIRGLVEDEEDLDGITELLRAWAVERRPELADGNPCLDREEDTCVALAMIELDVESNAGVLSVSDVTVDDSARPILVSTRLLQEVMFAAGGEGDHVHTLASLDDTEVDSASAGEFLAFDGANWVPRDVPAGGATSEHGDLDGLGADDHPQYLLADGSRDLTGDLSADGNRFERVAPSVANGQVIVHGQDAGGDLTGEYPDPQVGGLRGVPVAANAPDRGDVLIFDGLTWRPSQLEASPPPTTTVAPRMALPLATITQSDGRFWRVWFNLDAPANQVSVEEFDESSLQVFRENDSGRTFLTRVPIERILRRGRNLFLIETASQPTRPVRFIFNLTRIGLEDGQSVFELSTDRNIAFPGQHPDRPEQATIFVSDSLRNIPFTGRIR